MLKSKKVVKKTAPKKVKEIVLSDKDFVLSEYKTASIAELKGGFVVLGEKNNFETQIGAGIAKTKEDAWKKAARVV